MFVVNNENFEHARQDDYNSCGVCTINTIGHHLFGDSLFVPKQALSERLALFEMLYQHHRTEV